MTKKPYHLFLFVFFVSSNIIAQKQALIPDISKTENFTAINRDVNVINNSGKPIVHVDAKPDNGTTWLKNVTFQKGVIELDIKGKNMMQQSFVGIAFHGITDSTYDAVYFRPFNFQSPDTARRAHSVQYISLPKYDWFYLRQTYPGKYEKALLHSTDPDQWFHAKIVVGENRIEVFVNHDDQPSLVTEPLSHQRSGRIGFWLGNGSDGDFSNLSIQEN